MTFNNGSNSIKAVLPTICPDLSYNDLDIQDGTTAQLTWLELRMGDALNATFLNNLYHVGFGGVLRWFRRFWRL